MFEHCNEMMGISMPRDFLAGLMKYFVRGDGESLTFFQEAHREACEIMAHRRPHWGKRKVKSGSLYISIFFLIEREVALSNNPVCKQMSVEIYNSRDFYIDSLMNALDKTDEVEASMKEGQSMNFPPWILDGSDSNDVDSISDAASSSYAEHIDSGIDNLVLETLNVIKELSRVDKSKHVKMFTASESSLGIRHTKVKSRAKELGLPVPKFLTQKKLYPRYVTLKTETFTKMDAFDNHGTANTTAGFCTSIVFAKLSSDTQTKVLECLEMTNDDVVQNPIEYCDVELDDFASQDYPEFTQSQSSNTLQVCEYCDFTSRSKIDFKDHSSHHPKCTVCKKSFVNDQSLIEHMESHSTTKCNKNKSQKFTL